MRSSKKNKKLRKSVPKTMAVDTNCTVCFTAVQSLTTSLQSGTYTVHNNLTTTDFVGLDAFLGLFRYYTPKRLQWETVVSAAGNTGIVSRVRPLLEKIDAPYVSAVLSASTLMADPTTIRSVPSANRSLSSVQLYKDRSLRQTAVGASGDLLGAYNIVDPETTSAVTVVFFVKVVITFYERAAS
jgi:hypothetical protein